MKLWAPWLALVVLIAGYVVWGHSKAEGLLQDSDTKVLLEVVRERQDPLSWFGGDWPLENHFYRPVSTLFFELDNALYGDRAAGYGLTNALIAAGCILLAFWFFREVTGKPLWAGLAGALFGLWHLGPGVTGFVLALLWVAALLVWLGIIRGGRSKFLSVLLAFLGCVFAAVMFYVPHGTDVSGRIVHWLPGRTASVMTLFCLLAMASYARYERLTAGKKGRGEVTPYDLPGTKGSDEGGGGKWSFGWVVLSLGAAVLALGSYEQAVMLPAVYTGIAVLFLTMRRRPHWVVPVVSWGILVGYVLLRRELVPSEVSGYQAQQFRTGPGVYYSIADFFLPLVVYGRMWWETATAGILVIFMKPLWTLTFFVLGNLAGIYLIWKDAQRWLILFAQSMALVTYLPMSYLKYFGHYLYWPMVFWALFAVLLIQAVGRRVVTAISPPAVQAPLRPGL